MATQNFQIFDESLTDIDTDLEYQAEAQRINGVTPGLASPKLHNKLYRQCSVMAYAIASVLAARGFDAKDDDPATLVDSIQRAFAFSVNGNTPNASGAITAVRPIDAWPVGSLFMTFDNTNPATLLGGGTWVQIKGRYLLAADDGDVVDGSTTVGSMTKNVPLVAHTHTFTTGSAGAHTHGVSGATGGAGSHSHTRGTMNITGSITVSASDNEHLTDAESISTSGALSVGNYTTKVARSIDPSSNPGYDSITFNGANGWSGATTIAANHTHSFSATAASNGNHAHSGTTESNGTSASFDVRPLSLYVYMWRRTA